MASLQAHKQLEWQVQATPTASTSATWTQGFLRGTSRCAALRALHLFALVKGLVPKQYAHHDAGFYAVAGRVCAFRDTSQRLGCPEAARLWCASVLQLLLTLS